VATTDLERLRAALDTLSSAVDAVTPDALHRPTPCGSWDVGQLLDHVVGVGLVQLAVTAEGGKADWSAAPEPPAAGWATATRERSATLQSAWEAAPDDRFGALGQQLAEISVHTWDLGRALGVDLDFDEGAVEQGLQWARGMLKPEYRGSEADGKSFGPEVPVADGAPAVDRLAAWFGRDPGWTAPPT